MAPPGDGFNRASAALPNRFALLGERGRAFASVLGREDGAADLTLPGPALLLGPVDGVLDDRLRRDQRERRVLDDLVRELDCRIEREARFGKAVDNPDLVDALGADRL